MAIVDVFHQEHSDIITNNFKSFLENEVYIDLVFLCRNNKKVGAHQMVMGCLSKFLSQLLMENQSETKDKIIYVYVPDIRAKIMKHILQFIYTGKVMINKEELSEFNEDLLLLGMPLSVITSLDKTQPVNNDMTPINANNVVTQTTSYIGNVENFVPQTNIAISSIESLNCGVLASSNSNTLISGMRYLNQPDQMIVMNHQNSTINQYATNFVPSVMPVISTVTTLGANQISTDSTQPQSVGPKLEKLENKDITPNTRKRRKLIATSNTEKKLPKIDISQCINLDESDEDGDIITIS